MDLQQFFLLIQSRPLLPILLLAGGMACLGLIAVGVARKSSKSSEMNSRKSMGRLFVPYARAITDGIKISAVISILVIAAGAIGSLYAVQITPGTTGSFANKRFQCQPVMRCQFVLQKSGQIEILGHSGVSSGPESWKTATQLANIFVRLGDGETGIYRAIPAMSGAEILFYFLPYQQFVLAGLAAFFTFAFMFIGGASLQLWRFKSYSEEMNKSAELAMDEDNWQGERSGTTSGGPGNLVLGEPMPDAAAIFAGLSFLNADALRLIPLSDGMGFEPSFAAASSITGSDIYERFDPIIRAIAERTNHLFLQDTKKLFRNAGVQGVRLPASLFIQKISRGRDPVAILWGAFTTPASFTLADKKRVADLAVWAENPQATPGNKVDKNSAIEILKKVIDLLPDGAIISDPTDCMVWSNSAAEKLLNLDRKKAVGKKIETIIADSRLRSLMATKNKNNTATEIQLDNGVQVLVYSTPSMGGLVENQKLWLLRDIHLYHEQERLRSEFLNSVSHDLRGPLSLIRGYAGMIEMVGSLNDQQFIYTQKINAAIEDMTRLVNTILDLGRIDAGVRLQLELVTISDVVEGAMGSLLPIAQQRNILLEKTYVGGDGLIQVDPGLVQQALGNVIENGIKYTNSGGKVTVNVLHQKDWVRFEVSDTGLGISKADQAHLFEKFFRSQRAEVKARRGSGLGLAIVRSIVEQHTGKIWFESLEGVGSTFYLQLPVRQTQ